MALAEKFSKAMNLLFNRRTSQDPHTRLRKHGVQHRDSLEDLRHSCLLSLYSSKGCCKRCRGLSILPLLVTGNTRCHISTANDNFSSGMGDGMRLNLGPYQDMFRANSSKSCQLCALFRAVLPISDIEPQGNVYLVAARILSRLEPDIKVHYYEKQASSESLPNSGDGCPWYPDNVKRSFDLGYSNILYLSQGRAVMYADQALNAFGIALNDDIKGPRRTLPMMLTRKVPSSMADTAMIPKWFEMCDKDHGVRCKRRSTELVASIRLIDVETRIVTQYPQDEACEYTCLSYVWGEVKQKAYREGSKLPQLPRTLEDALSFVKALGKRYLWIDSVCIDQSNEEDKQRQISIMDQIYQCSWVTLVALSGDSADSGLPRTKPREKDQANHSSQVSGKFGKIQLMTALPTLRQQVKSSVWATRAWTYQEAILAPRCLYFTNEQVYFECNVMQCCESLDESSSSYHNACQGSKEYMSTGCHCHGQTQHVVGKGVLRDPMAEASQTHEYLFTKRRLEHYNELVVAYSERKMRYASDSINACTAILRQLEVAPGGFGKGFFWGLPVEEIQSALLWNHKGESTRRAEFPSWSWAGWEGALENAAIYLDPRDTINYTAPFRAWKVDEDGFRMICEVNREGVPRPYDRGEGVDPVYDALFSAKPPFGFDIAQFSTEQVSKVLFIEALVIDLELAQVWDAAEENEEQNELRVQHDVSIPNMLLRVQVDGKEFYFQCWNSRTASMLKRIKKITLLLADRRWPKDDFLLLQRTKPSCATRVGTVRALSGADLFKLPSAWLETIAIE